MDSDSNLIPADRLAEKQAIKAEDWARWLSILADRDVARLEALGLLPPVVFTDFDPATMELDGFMCGPGGCQRIARLKDEPYDG